MTPYIGNEIAMNHFAGDAGLNGLSMWRVRMKSSENFPLKDKDIDIHFKESECYKVKTGICPIEQKCEGTVKEMSAVIYRNEKFYCPYLLYKIKNYGFKIDSYMDEIIIHYHKHSNKYVVQEGRHRVCISLKSDISIKAIVTEVDSK